MTYVTPCDPFYPILPYSLRPRALLRSLVRSLAHFAHSLARGTVNDEAAVLSVFFFDLAQCDLYDRRGRRDTEGSAELVGRFIPFWFYVHDSFQSGI